MTLKQLIKLEDKAKEVWVISPSLHYDVENKDFSELVSVNLGQKTKYKYLVPGSKDIGKQIDLYKKKYQLSEEEVQQNFLILPEADFLPFMMEIDLSGQDISTSTKVSLPRPRKIVGVCEDKYPLESMCSYVLFTLEV